MTDVEDQLRRDLVIITERAQPGSIRPLRAPQPRRRSRAVRWLAPVAAMVAVIGIITGVSIAGRSAGNQPQSTALPVGTPKYYVTMKAVIPGNVTATVRDSLTGAKLASVLIAHVRPGEPYRGGLTWITAAANGRVFAIGDPFGVDILRLARGGRVGRLIHLPKKISGYQEGVLSPDGSELALPTGLSTKSCTKSSPCTNGVTVVSLTTGATTKWLARSAFQVGTFVVNWPGSGQELFFSYGLQYRLLNVAGPGGSLLGDSRPIAPPAVRHGWMLLSPLLTPDGKAVIWGSARSVGKDGATGGGILEVSVHTGRLLRVLYTATTPKALSSQNIFPACSLYSAGPIGLHVLTDCVRFGRLDGSHFTALPGGPARAFLGVQAAW